MFDPAQQGFESLDCFLDWLEERGMQHLFVVSDGQAADAAGISKALDSRKALNCTLFSEFRCNPQWNEVLTGVGVYQGRQSWDAVVAIGGGTAIDLAKLIRGFALRGDLAGDAEEDLSSCVTDATVPLIAIPTTAGTGSEATCFAVVYVEGVKRSVEHPTLLPSVVVVDWRLSATMPAKLTAATGLDAACQAMEAFWNVRSNADSDRLAQEAMTLALRHLPTAVENAAPLDRQAMSRAAHLAGRAINVTRTTAPHALSYHLTTEYDVPHGLAVALLFAPVLQANARADDSCLLDSRGLAHVRAKIDAIVKAIGGMTVNDAIDRWTEMLTRMNCPTRLSDVGLQTSTERIALAQAVNTHRLANNPVDLTLERRLELLEQIA